MVGYKIKFKDDLIMEIESERAINGDYNQLVYFWDCVKNERFDSVEQAQYFINDKMGATESNMVKIEEDKE